MSYPLSNNNKSGIMVGVTSEDGVILASTMPSYLIYYLDDRIYCCASNTTSDREAILEVGNKLQTMSLKNSGLTVTQTLDLLSKKYEHVENAQLMVAGEDVSGLHLVTIKSFGVQTPVCYAAEGTGAAEALEHLKAEWRADLSLRHAERVTRQAISIANTSKAKVDLFIVLKRPKDNK